MTAAGPSSDAVAEAYRQAAQRTEDVTDSGSVCGCPRCGGYHAPLRYERLKDAQVTWQATCPQTGKRFFYRLVLDRIDETGEPWFKATLT